MDKSILGQYIDACALVQETEDDIKRIKKKRKTIVQGVVKGSMHDFPYAAQNYHVEGIPYSVMQRPGQLEEEERLLEERKANAEDIRVQVEVWMNTIPQRMQRIIRFSIFQKFPWEEVAIQLGRRATAESVRKEFERFMREK